MFDTFNGDSQNNVSRYSNAQPISHNYKNSGKQFGF